MKLKSFIISWNCIFKISNTMGQFVYYLRMIRRAMGITQSCIQGQESSKFTEQINGKWWGTIKSICDCILTFLSSFFFPTWKFSFPSALLGYNWHIILCKFKVYMLIWYTYILQNDYHRSVTWHLHHVN